MIATSRNRALILSCFVAGNLFVWMLCAYFLTQSRHQYEHRAEVSSQNIATAIDQGLSGFIEKSDLAMRDVAEELAEDYRDGSRSAAVESLLAAYQQRIPDLNGMRITDAAGVVIFGQGPGTHQPVSYADRSFFPFLRDHPEAGLQVTGPILGRSTHSWVIAFVRRYTTPDGRFAGVISSAITLDHLYSIISQFDIGPRGGITLRGSDLGQIARYPGSPGDQVRELGNTTVSSELKELIRSGASRATYHTRTPFDDTERILTFHRLAAVPIIATVGLASQDYLAQWRSDLLMTCLLALSFLLLSLACAVVMLRAMRRLAEESGKLASSQERYRSLFEGAPFGIYRSTPGGRLISANPTIARMFGYPSAEAMVDDQSVSIGSRYVSSEQRAGMVRQALAAGGYGQAEVEFQRCDASRFVANLHMRAVPGSGGELLEGFLEDITGRKLADEALRVSESKFRIIFDNEVYAICIFEVDSKLILDVNEAHVAMYGYSREELCDSGMRATELIGEPEDSELSVRIIGQTRTMFVPLRLHRKKDGTLFPVEIVGGAYLWNGRRVMFGMIHDITERVKAEQSLKSYAQRLIVQEEDLRKQVSRELHDDIGQELTALGLDLAHIGSHLPAQSGDELQSTLADSRLLTKEISRSVRNLMLDLRPALLEDFGLAGALGSYLNQYAQRSGLAAALEVSPDFPRLAPKQEIALFRITQEALNNVAKYAAASKVTVSLCSAAGLVRLSIADDGQGFEPREGSLQPAGSGWGLTIMRERAELAGGRFRLATEPGAGTTIIIEVSEGD